MLMSLIQKMPKAVTLSTLTVIYSLTNSFSNFLRIYWFSIYLMLIYRSLKTWGVFLKMKF